MSAPRVYLMADTGKGPKCAISYKPGATLQELPSRKEQRAYNARRWWLVEAENADAARETIEHASRRGDAVLSHIIDHGTPSGRILDSGGAS